MADQYIDMFQNLIDAGCNIDVVEEFFQLQASGRSESQLALLYHQRRFLLEKVHDYQKSLDCLDYLILKMKKKKQD